MPRKTNGTAPRISERDRLEDGIRQLHARLEDIKTRERYKKELAEFLGKRTLLTRLDVSSVAIEILQGRRPKRGNLAAITEAEGGSSPRNKMRAARGAAKGKFGKALRQWREDKSLSHPQAAAKLGANKSSIARWESGGPVRPEMRPAILKATGLPEDVFK